VYTVRSTWASAIIKQIFDDWPRNQDARPGKPVAPDATAARVIAHGLPRQATHAYRSRAANTMLHIANVFSAPPPGDATVTYHTTDSGQLTLGIAGHHCDRWLKRDMARSAAPAEALGYLNQQHSLRCPRGAIEHLAYVPAAPSRRARVVAGLRTGLSPSVN
jgi:hypothetical protein